MQMEEMEQRLSNLEQAFESLNGQMQHVLEELKLPEGLSIPGAEFPFVSTSTPKKTIRVKATFHYRGRGKDQLALTDSEWADLAKTDGTGGENGADGLV